MSERDEVVEAMARGMWRWRWRKYAEETGDPGVADRMWDNMSEDQRERYRGFVRAAIRALPPGWVVAKVPDERIRPDSVPWRYGDAWGGRAGRC